jgi:hypothetical protein
MHAHSPSKPSDIIELNVLESKAMRGFLLLLPLLLLHGCRRRQHGDDPSCRCRRLEAATGAADFPHTHAMRNKGGGGGTPGGTTRPWQCRSCCRYGNDDRQTMLDHGESRLEIFILLLLLMLQFVFCGFSNHVDLSRVLSSEAESSLSQIL